MPARTRVGSWPNRLRAEVTSPPVRLLLANRRRSSLKESWLSRVVFRILLDGCFFMVRTFHAEADELRRVRSWFLFSCCRVFSLDAVGRVFGDLRSILRNCSWSSFRARSQAFFSWRLHPNSSLREYCPSTRAAGTPWQATTHVFILCDHPAGPSPL